MHIRMYKTNL